MISVETQASTLRNLLKRMTPHGLVRGGVTIRENEAEVAIAHLREILRTLEGLAAGTHQ